MSRAPVRRWVSTRRVWESFDPSDQKIIAAVAASEYARSLAEFSANNALSLRKLQDEGTVKILKFDNSLLKTFLEISKDVVAEIGSGDDLSKKIYNSYRNSEHRSWIGATSPNAHSSTAAGSPDRLYPHLRNRANVGLCAGFRTPATTI